MNNIGDAKLHSVVTRYSEVHDAYAQSRRSRDGDFGKDSHGRGGFAVQQHRDVLSEAFRAVQGSDDIDDSDARGNGTEVGVARRKSKRGISAPDLIEFGYYLGQTWSEIDCFRALNLGSVELNEEDGVIPMISESAFLKFCASKLQIDNDPNATEHLLGRVQRFVAVKSCSVARLRVLEDCLRVLQSPGASDNFLQVGLAPGEVWCFAFIVRSGFSPNERSGEEKQPCDKNADEILGTFVADGIRDILALAASKDQQVSSSSSDSSSVGLRLTRRGPNPAAVRGLWLSVSAHMSEGVAEAQFAQRVKTFQAAIRDKLPTLPSGGGPSPSSSSSRRIALRLLQKDLLSLSDEPRVVEKPSASTEEADSSAPASLEQPEEPTAIIPRRSHLESLPSGDVDSIVEGYLAAARIKAKAKRREEEESIPVGRRRVAREARGVSGRQAARHETSSKVTLNDRRSEREPRAKSLRPQNYASHQTNRHRNSGEWPPPSSGATRNEGSIRPHIRAIGAYERSARKPSMVQLYACIALQAMARGVVLRCRYRRVVSSIIFIQSWWRRLFGGRCDDVAHEVRKLQLMSSEVVSGVRKLVQTSKLRISGDVVGANTIAALERAGLDSANQLGVVAEKLMQLRLEGAAKDGRQQRQQQQWRRQLPPPPPQQQQQQQQLRQQPLYFIQEAPPSLLSPHQQRQQQQQQLATPLAVLSPQTGAPVTIRPKTATKPSGGSKTGILSDLSTGSAKNRSRVSFQSFAGNGEALIFDETMNNGGSVSPSGASYPSGTDGEGEEEEEEEVASLTRGEAPHRSSREQKPSTKEIVPVHEEHDTNGHAEILAVSQQLAEAQKRIVELPFFKSKAQHHLKAQHAVIQKLAKMAGPGKLHDGERPSPSNGR